MKASPRSTRKLGPYEVLEKIAQGGMGEVYKGFQPALERYVAIKLLSRSLQVDPSLTQRFQREAKAAAALRHPNIVQVIDFGEQDDAYYMVMEYVEGTNLRTEMDRRRKARQPFTPDEILHLLGQVADALDYAHQHGVIHRDVKPANILLTPDGQAILSDFGLAMLRDRASQATLGHSFGTPEYIAPEQAIDSRAAVPQSDIYSLGGILYEMVTGELPFEAESSISLALKHISEDPTPPSTYVPDLAPAVEAVILRALAKEPNDRFPTARALIEALREAWLGQAAQPPRRPVSPPLSPPPVVSPPASPPPAARPAPKRTGRFVIGALVILIAVLAVGLFYGVNRGYLPLAAALATRTSTPTLMPTRTPAPPTATQSPLPSATLTSLPPTATPTPLALLPPTVAFSPTPTNTPTPAPTNTPTQLPSPTPTPTLAAGQIFTRTVDGMIMRFVPAGPFLMGTTDDPDAAAHEKPQHTVRLSAFWIDQTEVTNAQYRRCVEAGGCTPPTVRKFYDAPAYADHPVVYVKWVQANSYCQWLAQQTNWDVHLPSEAQWEKAASWDPLTEVKRRYPWGDQDPTSALLNYEGSWLNRTVAVGSYPQGASAYGALDMAGNVWEWVADWYDKDYYKTPNLPDDPSGPDKGKQRVMRGGSFEFGAREARTTHRDVGDPEKANGPGLGFRCAVSGEQLP